MHNIKLKPYFACLLASLSAYPQKEDAGILAYFIGKCQQKLLIGKSNWLIRQKPVNSVFKY